MSAMLPELSERDAAGEIAAIYDEIRRFSGVPYVSSMQRHLATRPGWLEWAWAALRPAFASGRAQAAAWSAAERLAVPALPPVAREALRVWGVDAGAEQRVRAVCDTFVRVSPVNLVFSGLLRRLLRGERPGGAAAPATGWTPPAPLPGLPPMADPASLGPAERAVLASLGTAVGGQPFVPGLYRLLAGWPALLAHLATVLRPHLDAPPTRETCRRLGEAIDAAVPAVLAALPPLPAEPPMPPAAELDGVLAALDTYRVTSPQMVVFGRMIRAALPPLEPGDRPGP